MLFKEEDEYQLCSFMQSSTRPDFTARSPQDRFVLCLRCIPSGRLRLFSLSSADIQQEGSRSLVPCSQHRGDSHDLEKRVLKLGQFCH